MGMAPVAHVVFNKFMTFNPKNPKWVNRDRFVLSYVLSCAFLHTHNGSHGRQAGSYATILK
jgi:transketolase